MTAPRLLLSAQARGELGVAIAQAAGERPLALVTLEDIAGDDTQAVDAAFISRDITGLSTKHQIHEPLAACYRVLRRSPALAWVHTHSAGADRPIYAELMARNVAVSTSAGANAEVVAQTALGAVIALSRRFAQLFAAQQRREWAPLVAAGPAPADLAGQTAVIVGWGGIAQRLQRWLTMLGLTVIVVRHGSEPAGPGIETHRYGNLKQVLPRAQWLLLACPLSDATRRLVDAPALAALPQGAMLVNVARGEVVDEAALTEALRSGRLGGAFLDVFEHEPLPASSPLWGMPNTIVTPHAASHAAGNAARAAAIFTDNLRRWLRGEPLANLVNRA